MPRRRPKAVVVDLRSADGACRELSGVKTRTSTSNRARAFAPSSEESRVYQEVHDMFKGTVDDAVIQTVVQQTQYDAERAVDILFDLSARAPPLSSTAPAAASRAEPARTIADNDTGTPDAFKFLFLGL